MSASRRQMSTKQPGVAKRIASAIVASAAGLIIGASAASVISAIVLLLRGAFGYSSLQGLLWLAIGLFTEGMCWSLLGGAMFVLPPAVLALVAFRPRNTQAAAAGLSLVLLVPLLIGYYPRTLS